MKYHQMLRAHVSLQGGTPADTSLGSNGNDGPGRIEGSQPDPMLYEQRRKTRLVYLDADLHLQVCVN